MGALAGAPQGQGQGDAGREQGQGRQPRPSGGGEQAGGRAMARGHGRNLELGRAARQAIWRAADPLGIGRFRMIGEVGLPRFYTDNRRDFSDQALEHRIVVCARIRHLHHRIPVFNQFAVLDAVDIDKSPFGSRHLIA